MATLNPAAQQRYNRNRNLIQGRTAAELNALNKYASNPNYFAQMRQQNPGIAAQADRMMATTTNNDLMRSAPAGSPGRLTVGGSMPRAGVGGTMTPAVQPQATVLGGAPAANAPVTLSAAPGGRRGLPPTGLRGSELARTTGLRTGEQALRQGINLGRQDVANWAGAATENLGGYSGPGQDAARLQAALTGALGPDEQARAIAEYQASPGQQWLQEETERGILRNAAALGGLGGGGVLKELQRNAAGLARQDFGDQFARLGTVADRGLTGEGLRSRILADTGRTLGDMAFTGGLSAADMRYRTGESRAADRTRAGERIADAAQMAVSDAANLVSRGGLAAAEGLQTTGGNLANLLMGRGRSQLLTDQQLATLLANLGVQSGTQFVGASGLPGVQDTGILGSIGSLLSGVGGFVEGIRTPRPTP